MTVTVWTHPKHRNVAVAATMVSMMSCLLDLYVIFFIPWFTNKRKEFGVTNADRNGYHFINTDVVCTDDFCVKSSYANMPDWQKLAFTLGVIGATSCVLSFGVQLFLFWPIIGTGRVSCNLLRICRILDFYGSPPKFIAAFIYIAHAGEINKNFAWRKREAILQLEVLPIGVLLISYILQVICFIGMTVAIDRGPPNGPPYLQIIHEDLKLAEEEQEIATQDVTVTRRRSSFVPDSSEDHKRILRKVSVANDNQESAV
ncbi:uncharacterized protein LOC131950386 [Physella acuta]|uniref:uncharacterized protein LOC131950386 n=1 Tax=Physella acuta TaxID=109671 RepID=UPI0027DE537D|nr:uncharacterized protein LOC131950386 [Physella acuta]